MTDRPNNGDVVGLTHLDGKFTVTDSTEFDDLVRVEDEDAKAHWVYRDNIVED